MLKGHHFGVNIKKLLRNKNFLILSGVFGFTLAVLDSHATVSGEIATVYGFKTTDASLFGAIFILSGLCGAIVFGIWVDKKESYK